MIVRDFIENSRKEANFVSRMNSESRDTYIKLTAGSYEWKSLVPFIQITKIHKYYRQVDYVIKLPDINGEKNEMRDCVYHSRRTSDNLLRMPKKQRDQSVKDFIAHCYANKLLSPYVTIIEHDDKFRKIEYELNIREIMEGD